MSQNINPFLFIGKQIKDEYGRPIGKVISLALTPNGKFDAVYLEKSDGRFLKYPMEYLKFEGEEVTLLSEIKSKTNALCDQIPLIWRKDQALKDLSEKNKISRELYEELHNNFEGVLNQLRTEAQSLIEELDKEIARCTNEIKALNYALVHLELEHEIGKIDDQSYEMAFMAIQENLTHINKEKEDLELTKNRLSNIILGEKTEESSEPQVEEEPATGETTPETEMETPLPETPTETPTETPANEEPSQPSESPELPEPPVVVYVKEVGESGVSGL